MACFMVGQNLLVFIGKNNTLALYAEHYPVSRHIEMVLGQLVAIVSAGKQRCLIDKVCQLSPGKP